MKKRILLAGIILTGIMIIGYVAPIIVSKVQAEDYYGNFGPLSECIGGHESFLLLEESECFEYCPGHRWKDKRFSITRDEEGVLLHSIDDNTAVIRITKRNGMHFLVRLDEPEKEIAIEQISNPWRTWLPSKLPE